MGWQGQELLLASTVASCVGTIRAVYGKGWAKQLLHHQPVVALSCTFAGIGLLMPITIVPLRRSLGYPTNQYDAFTLKEGQFNAPALK